jgi:hypothetical protein
MPLRTDFTAAQVRAAAKETRVGPLARRLLAIATTYDSGTRSDATRIGGVTLQIVGFGCCGSTGRHPEPDRKALGQPARLLAAERAALAAQVESGPNRAIHGAVRWSITDQCQCLFQERKASISN